MSLVLLDCDGVLLDFVGALRKKLPAMEDPEVYDLRRHRMWPQIHEVMQLGWFESTIEFYPGALDFLTAIKRKGHEPVLVTSPGVSPGWDHARTVRLRGLGCEWNLITPDLRSRLDAPYLLDDHPDTIRNFDGPDSVGVLFLRPWNKATFDPTTTVGVTSYAEFLELLP